MTQLLLLVLLSCHTVPCEGGPEICGCKTDADCQYNYVCPMYAPEDQEDCAEIIARGSYCGGGVGIVSSSGGAALDRRFDQICGVEEQEACTSPCYGSGLADLKGYLVDETDLECRSNRCVLVAESSAEARRIREANSW